MTLQSTDTVKITAGVIRLVDMVAKEFLGPDAGASKIKLPNGSVRMFLQNGPDIVALVASFSEALSQIHTWVGVNNLKAISK